MAHVRHPSGCLGPTCCIWPRASAGCRSRHATVTWAPPGGSRAVDDPVLRGRSSRSSALPVEAPIGSSDVAAESSAEAWLRDAPVGELALPAGFTRDDFLRCGLFPPRWTRIRMSPLSAGRRPAPPRDDRTPLPIYPPFRLSKPSRYLGNEYGAARKPWTSARLRFALSFPEVYEVGASSHGHLLLYALLNQKPGVLCDRVYMPGEDLRAMLQARRATGASAALFAVESKRGLRDFDVIGFSLAYELGATNILEMLHLAGIPLTWKERAECEGALPLVFAGGPSATSNPEPFSDFFDFFVLGDGESALREVADRLLACREARMSRKDTLAALAATVEGVYVPQLYEPLAGWGGAVFPIHEAPLSAGLGPIPAKVKRRVDAPDPLAHASLSLVPYTATVHDRLTVEIRRGCTRGCRFCQPGKSLFRQPRSPLILSSLLPISVVGPFPATFSRALPRPRNPNVRNIPFLPKGYMTRPARDADPEEVIRAVREGLLATGYDEVTLLSLSCSDYLSLPSVGLRLRNELGPAVSLQLPSQRVDRFDDAIADILGAGSDREGESGAGTAASPRAAPAPRRGGLTFAPEAGTQRLRDIINKGLTDEELVRGVSAAWRRGWRQVKLYFMIGLPGETDADVLGIADTVRLLLSRGHRGCCVSITISNFTPKPHTPFQWHSVSTAEFRRKQELLRGTIRRLGYGSRVKASYTDPRLSAMEDFIGRGDRRVGAVIRRAWERGCLNAGWWENSEAAFKAWGRAIEDAGLSWKYRQVEQGEWDVMEHLGDAAYRGQGGGGKGRLDRGALADARLDAPLPWDVVDSGITRAWLKADLQRALEASVVPDCSYAACSECGVCGEGGLGDDLSNVLFEPPEPPELAPTDAAGGVRGPGGKGGRGRAIMGACVCIVANAPCKGLTDSARFLFLGRDAHSLTLSGEGLEAPHRVREAGSHVLHRPPGHRPPPRPGHQEGSAASVDGQGDPLPAEAGHSARAPARECRAPDPILIIDHFPSL